jgi:hypothetical protein
MERIKKGSEKAGIENKDRKKTFDINPLTPSDL